MAIYSRKEPLRVQIGMGVPEIDSEGRVLLAEYPGFVLVNAYFPNSQREHARLGYKLEFCKRMFGFLEKMRGEGKQIVICGDPTLLTGRSILKIPKPTKTMRASFPKSAPG